MAAANTKEGGGHVTINDMRGHVIAAYSGEDWRKKVLKMPDNQVLAIYKRLQSKGRVK